MRKHFKRILSATDLSEISNPTIKYGIDLALEFQAKLFICHIINLPSVTGFSGDTPLDPIAYETISREYTLDELNRLIKNKKVNWEPIIRLGNTSNEISRLALEKNIDLVITATHGRSGLKRLLLGSVTEKLIRSLSCPLLIVRSTDKKFNGYAPDGFKFKRILVGCDFSPDSDLAFQYGLSLAQEFLSELHLVHVIEQPVYLETLHPPIENIYPVTQDFRNHVKNHLNNMVPEDARNWCKPIVRLLNKGGQPYSELIKYAKNRDIDLIVLGARGLTLVEKMLIGSTTDRVIRLAPSSVLSVSQKVNMT